MLGISGALAPVIVKKFSTSISILEHIVLEAWGYNYACRSRF